MDFWKLSFEYNPVPKIIYYGNKILEHYIESSKNLTESEKMFFFTL